MSGNEASFEMFSDADGRPTEMEQRRGSIVKIGRTSAGSLTACLSAAGRYFARRNRCDRVLAAVTAVDCACLIVSL